MSRYRNLRNGRRSLPDNLLELARREENDGIMRFDEMHQDRGESGGRGSGRGGDGRGRGRGNRCEQLHNNNDHREPLAINNQVYEPLIIEELQIPSNADGNNGNLQAAAGYAGENNAENAQAVVNQPQNNEAPENVQRSIDQENAENNGARGNEPPRVLNTRNTENVRGTQIWWIIPKSGTGRNYGPYRNYNVYTKKSSNSFKDSRIYSLEKSVYHLYKVLKDKPTSNENSNLSPSSAMSVGTSTICPYAAVPPAATMPLNYSPAIPVAPPMSSVSVPTMLATNFPSMPMAYTSAPTMPMANMLRPAIPVYESTPMPPLHAMMRAIHPYYRAPAQQLPPYPSLQPSSYAYQHFY